MGMHRRPSAEQRRIYLRRRIVAGLIVVAVIVVPVVLLTGGGGGKKAAGGHSTTTTTTKSATTTTTPPAQMVVATAPWHLPVPLSRSVVLTINTNLGIFGGLTTGATSHNDYEIGLPSGIATTIGTMPAPVHDAGGAVIGSTYFVFGGGGTTETAAIQRFSFTDSTHLTGSVVTALPAKRAEMGTTTYGGQTYLVGGFDGKAWLPSILSTADGLTFAAVAQLNTAVRFAAVAALDDKLFVIGGELSPNAADSTTVQELNLSTDAVTSLSPLAAGLSHAAAAVVNNTIYVFGGRSGGKAIATISELNTTTGQLLAVGQLPGGIGRSDMGVDVIGDTAYLVGGETSSGTPLNSVVTVSLEPAG